VKQKSKARRGFPASPQDATPPEGPTPLSDGKGFQRAIIGWFRREGKDYPWRHTTDPYAILVSEMMLQQTQVATVLGRRYFENWLEAFPTPAALAAASEQELLRAWEGLGYYNRARNLQRTARAICEEHGGTFPPEVEKLRQLPGLGDYTAGAVATFAFDAPAPIVDANIARVLARLFHFTGLVDAEPGKSQLWQWAGQLVPRRDARVYNSGLMELGQRICLPKQPICTACPVAEFCAGRDHHPERLPARREKRATIQLTEHAIFAVCGGKILLHRENGSRRRGMWKLPERPESALTEFLARPLLTVTYTITHHRVRLCIYELSGATAGPDESWRDVSCLPKLPMPSPYRKALIHLLGR